MTQVGARSVSGDVPTPDALARRLDAAVAATPAGSAPGLVSQALLDVLLTAVHADGGALVLMHPQTSLFWTGAVTGLPAATCRPFFDLEVAASSELSFRRMAASGATATAVARAGPEDAIAAEVLVPSGYTDDLRAVCRDAGAVWGGVSLWRRDATYSPAQERLLEAVSPMVGAHLRTAVLSSLDGPTTGRPVRGVVVLDGDRVVEISPELRDVLRSLARPDLEEYRHLDNLIALASSGPSFSTVLGTDDGRWMSAHGTALGSGKVAIVISTASAADLFGTRVAGAGLSDREVEVTGLLCRGLSDAEIARSLQISRHTVHDHVRAVRRKLGVRSRSEVAATVFADHYFAGFLESAAIAHAPSADPASSS